MSSLDSSFPQTLDGFGYNFNGEGRLRKIDSNGQCTDTPFEFCVSSDAAYNQKHYEALGEVITQHVYGLLEKERLIKLPLPKNSGSSSSSFIFATEDALTCDKLIILVHGSGVVRAGQWARSLIINDSLQSGTQIPFINKGRDLSYGILILNTNDNARVVDGKKISIEGSRNPQEHANTAWNDYILKAKATKIAIVAHSYGGVVTMSLASKFEEDFLKRVFAIALTDSVHGKIPRAVSSTLADHLAKIGRNLVSCGEPLDTPLPEQTGEIQCFSSGTSKHELTSWSCIESLFRFLEERRSHQALGGVVGDGDL